MLRSRIIPILLLRGEGLVKTVKFNKYSYIGDPCNTVRIFNELEVDEISILDIDATVKGRDPNYNLIEDIASEAFMPLSYGGGVDSLDKAKKILNLGIEKVILNTAAIKNPSLITEISEVFGSQAVVVSIDVKSSFFTKKYSIFTHSGRKKTNLELNSWAKRCEEFGAGEILLNNISRDGTWNGYDLELYRSVQKEINVPLIGCGGAKDIDDVAALIRYAKCSAAGIGSMVVFQKKDKGVLVNFPRPEIVNKKIYN